MYLLCKLITNFRTDADDSKLFRYGAEIGPKCYGTDVVCNFKSRFSCSDELEDEIGPDFDRFGVLIVIRNFYLRIGLRILPYSIWKCTKYLLGVKFFFFFF